MGTRAEGVQPNPRRVAAGRRNRLKWKGLTDAGHERLRQAALRIKPWTRSTGPKTPEGKARTARNGCWRQRNDLSERAICAAVAEVNDIIDRLVACRRAAEG